MSLITAYSAMRGSSGVCSEPLRVIHQRRPTARGSLRQRSQHDGGAPSYRDVRVNTHGGDELLQSKRLGGGEAVAPATWWEGSHDMFQHILVPLDGTVETERAVTVAARLAQAAGGVVTLLRVVHPQWEPDAPLGALVGLAPADTETIDAADYLTAIRQRGEMADVASCAAIAVGPVVPAILKAAGEDDVDLIVLCQHKRARWARGWRRRGIAEQVARRAPVPVLVLHEEDRLAAVDGVVATRLQRKRALTP